MNTLLRPALAGLALAAVALPLAARSETVLARRRLGNDTEDLTIVQDGRWRGRVVAIDGMDVISIDVGASPAGPATRPAAPGLAVAAEAQAAHRRGDGLSGFGWQKIFEVDALGAGLHSPRGIVYVPGVRRFYFSSVQPEGVGFLYAATEDGVPLPPLPVAVPNPSTVTNWEGLTWIPDGAPAHGGTILGVLQRQPGPISSLVYVRLDGTIEAEVKPEAGTPLETYLCGVEYQPRRGTLLANACGKTVWEMGLDGRLLSSAAGAFEAPWEPTEGMAIDERGRIFTAGYDAGLLAGYDPDYRRAPALDRSFRIGLGVAAGYMAWDPDQVRFLATSRGNRVLHAIAADLGAATPLFRLDEHLELGMPNYFDYLGGGRIAVANRNYPRGVAVIDLATGTLLSRLAFQGPAFPAAGGFNPIAVTPWGPEAFAVRLLNQPGRLAIVSRAGTPVPWIYPDAVRPDLLGDVWLVPPSETGSAKAYDAGEGRRIFTGAEIYDGDGQLLHLVDAAALGIRDYLGSGAWMGGNTFSAVDGDTSTVIVFTIP